MKVGDLVRETFEGTIGTVTGEHWKGGFVVYFPEYQREFHMEPGYLEVINADR